jgi:rhamnosyltransferase
MKMNRKIGGCVILFHPEAEVVSNIQSYCAGVDALFVIDNSLTEDQTLIARINALSDKIVYRWLGGNKGLSAALNIACRMALDRQYDWILTMDQDSSFLNNDLAALIEGVDAAEKRFGVVGILSPYHLVSTYFDRPEAARFTETRFVMTSGNLLNLRAMAGTGPFEEKLFIDCIDMDYCLRLRKAGYHIIQDNSIRLRHSLGDFKEGKLVALPMGYSNHNPLRRYYITRNRVFLLKKYLGFDPKLCWLQMRATLGDVVRILFFEQDKGLKFRAMLTGLWHSLTNHYGPYNFPVVVEKKEARA